MNTASRSLDASRIQAAMGDKSMEYKSLDFVGMFSLIFGALSVLGLVALTFGPWAQPAPMARTFLTVSLLVFWMIGAVARNVRALLEAQADQIAALQRQVSEPRPTA